jgi:hypothetical protein
MATINLLTLIYGVRDVSFYVFIYPVGILFFKGFVIQK